jgi:2-polyprenyl-3-methyl-5-hydroxy-6-metoxy-1,4-benzoquinol methylase
MTNKERYLKSEKWGITRLYALKQLEVVGSRLDWFTNKNVLDIGCGKGILEAMFSSLAKSFVSCDIIDQNIYNLKIKLCRAEELEFSANSADIIFMLGVIEHIPVENRYLAVKKFYEILRPDGKLIISIPNGLFWKVLRLVRFILPEHLKLHSLFGEKELNNILENWKLIKKYRILPGFFCLYEFQKP